MALTRWTNPSLPQTLQIGMFLLYIEAVFGVLETDIQKRLRIQQQAGG